jgi:HEAT repeat protein
VGKYGKVRKTTGWGVPGPTDTSRTADQVDELVCLTRHADPKVRTVAVVNLCPCHARANFPAAWDRILEMISDPEPLVRRAVVHMLADGSPRERQGEVIEAMMALRNDPDRTVRRHVRLVLDNYRRRGRVNVL